MKTDVHVPESLPKKVSIHEMETMTMYLIEDTGLGYQGLIVYRPAKHMGMLISLSEPGTWWSWNDGDDHTGPRFLLTKLPKGTAIINTQE